MNVCCANIFDHNLIAVGAGEKIRRLLSWDIQQLLSDFVHGDSWMRHRA